MIHRHSTFMIIIVIMNRHSIPCVTLIINIIITIISIAAITTSISIIIIVTLMFITVHLLLLLSDCGFACLQFAALSLHRSIAARCLVVFYGIARCVCVRNLHHFPCACIGVRTLHFPVCLSDGRLRHFRWLRVLT